ncbi:hypothetical protein [Halobellus inordinatus]|uniref:hypothetical protein n=1 Tax=Halobellus inordinatus TaxID=1126236 RepID=UPI0021155BF2|nr:hypothetical protein [Halobellus ramosii]
MAQQDQIGDRAEWVLRILYAPVKGKTAVPIVGITRLMKACFLVHKKLDAEEGIQTDFSFYPGDYGPIDDEVYSTLERLQSRGLVEERESRKYDGTEYVLTTEGIDRAEELFEELSGSERELLSWIKGKHVLKPLSKLLSFVYNRYPKYAENSKLT